MAHAPWRQDRVVAGGELPPGSSSSGPRQEGLWTLGDKRRGFAGRRRRASSGHRRSSMASRCSSARTISTSIASKPRPARWSPAPAQAGGTIAGTAAVIGDQVIVGAMNGKVTAFDRESGRVAWTAKADAPVSPAERWRRRIWSSSAPIAATCSRWGWKTARVAIRCAPAGDQVPPGGAGERGLVHELRRHPARDRPSLGEERWSFAGQGRRLYSSPAVLGRTAFFGSLSGAFYAATWVAGPAKAAMP